MRQPLFFRFLVRAIFAVLIVLVFTSVSFADDRFDLLVALFNEDSPAAKGVGGANAYVGEVIKNNVAYTKCFKKHGDQLFFYRDPEPEFSCLLDGSCYWSHATFLENELRKEFLPGDFKPKNEDIQYLQNLVGTKQLDGEILSRLEKFTKEITQVKKVKRLGNLQAKEEVWLFHNGHVADKLQEEAVKKLLTSYPKQIRFTIVQKRDYPELFSLIGERWSAGALIRGELVKDLYLFEPWSELLFDKAVIERKKGEFIETPVFDAHEHVRSVGEKRWLEIMEDNQITTSVVAALPRGIDYQGLSEENDELLRFAGTQVNKIVPLVMLQPNNQQNLELFKGYQTRGNRGLKLINGHGDYFTKNHQIVLDTPQLREVFRYAEAHSLPVLWHVNSHLFMKGFFATLHDFPKLKVVIPHLAGYLANAPSIVRDLLRVYPNLFIDISFGVKPSYLRRSLEDISLRNLEWRQLFLDQPDRFLFGVDFVVTNETTRAHAKMLFETYRSLLEKKSYDLHFFPARGYSYFYEDTHFREGLNGLALPEEVLRKVYWENAQRIYGNSKTQNDKR